jgi:NAD(P)-dependent dehydrogenase (short-subunit alcohol dehydrogenase family)
VGFWVVTGGASGIGKQIARDAALAGNVVLVWDLKQGSADENLTFDRVDLTKPEEIVAAAERITGDVDCFVHCAGVLSATSVMHDNLVASMLMCFQIHCLAFASAVQALLPKFSGNGASVIAITSAGTDMVYPGTVAYGASKSALQRTIIQFAVELGGRRIRVNGISPGAIATEMTRHLWANPAFAAERLRHIPLGHQAEPKAVSDAVRFLASEAANYITGETLWVDGGVRHGIFQTRVREAMQTAKNGGA